MSRIGKIPVQVPQGINVEIGPGEVKVKGPKGELKTPFKPELVGINFADGQITVSLKNPEEKAYYGLIRKLIFNMVQGQQTGYEKKLEISGVGYKASIQGKKLSMTLGFSHPVEITIPDAISVEVVDNTKMTMKSADREALGDFAARIRGLRPVEPYKGKGIKYQNEIVRRKVGKTGV